ncbi:MAG: HEPN domain-containing protein [bacterium]
MIDIQKHIDYWVKTAESDIEIADILISKNKIKHGLFFCHLILEKILKAHFIKNTGAVAPKIHDLIYLVNKSNLSLSNESVNFLIEIQRYQLEGRYPDYEVSIPLTSES